jgi:hypothetical protein
MNRNPPGRMFCRSHFKRRPGSAGAQSALFQHLGPRGPPEELGRLDAQDGRQLPDDLQPDVGPRPLDPAHVGAIDLGVVGQLLLRQLPLVPYPPKVGRESDLDSFQPIRDESLIVVDKRNDRDRSDVCEFLQCGTKA